MELEPISRAQRLHLINQFLILEKLYPENADKYAEDRDIIAHGYVCQYEDVLNPAFEEMSMEDGKYVYQVLDMYRILIQAYDALSDKQGLTLEDVTFKGFDGNNESKRHSFAEHLRKQGRWTETLKGSLNSHSMVTMSLYPRMLAKFPADPCGKVRNFSHGQLATNGRADQRNRLVDF